MNEGRMVFSQVMDFLPQHEFRRCVKRYQGNHRMRSFSCMDQFLCMAFAQISYRDSLRDIVCCLRSMQHKLYHMGIRGNVSRSTLADANEKRDWRIYADFAQVLIQRARELYVDDDFGIDLNETVYALDSSTIELCLSGFPWAKFRQHKAAVKLHTLLDLRGNIPTFISITDGKYHDVNILDVLVPEPASFYIMDRAYLDFSRLHIIKECSAFFVIRSKSNTRFRRVYSNPVDKATGVKCDQAIVLTGQKATTAYPDKLRRVKYYDAEKDRRFNFLTNNFAVPAITIADLYRCRWQVELFFKWVKQHLRIKSFYGTTENAVKSQIWIAVSVYVLVAIVRKRLHLTHMSLYTILQILSISLFEKTPILQILTDSDYTLDISGSPNQLELFDS